MAHLATDKRSVFLVVEKSETPVRDWRAVTFVQRAQVEDRPIGVLTKCARAQTEQELDILRSILDGKEKDMVQLHPYKFISWKDKLSRCYQY